MPHFYAHLTDLPPFARSGLQIESIADISLLPPMQMQNEPNSGFYNNALHLMSPDDRDPSHEQLQRDTIENKMHNVMPCSAALSHSTNQDPDLARLIFLADHWQWLFQKNQHLGWQGSHWLFITLNY